MAKESKRLTQARYDEIQKRQSRAVFGAEYQPAMRATKEEAPRIAIASAMKTRRLGRHMHLMSPHELAAAVIALYNPNVKDIHEQKVLSPMPSAHPLFDYPGINNSLLLPVQGTMNVAERLGVFEFHPGVQLQREGWPVPRFALFPWLGDLLLYCQDPVGIYCVNWNVKPEPEDFYRPMRTDTPNRRPKRAREKSIARHSVEEIYYADVGVRTEFITHDRRLTQVIENLLICHGYDIQEVDLNPGVREQMVARLNACLRNHGGPLEAMFSLVRSFGCSLTDCQRVFYQSIWRRELRIDLYKPILPEHPLWPEERDVLREVADRFRR
jgi:hypothetical protein